jgi:glycosyltransferase involved in cell wall biosynthesis
MTGETKSGGGAGRSVATGFAAGRSSSAAPRVSVVIPAYNRAGTVVWSVRSVLGQSFDDIEAIVVDDCSSDGTLEALAQIDDPRLRTIRLRENGGAARARNAGIAAARGDFVAFHDSDDLWLPAKLEEQVAGLERLGPDYVALYGGKLLYGKSGSGRYAPGTAKFVPDAGAHDPSDRVLASLVRGNHLTIQSTLIRAGAFARGLRFDDRLRCNEDWDFALRLAQLGKIAYRPAPHCVAIISGDSISRNRSRNALSILTILRSHRDVFRRHPKARAQHLFAVARHLSKTGRPRRSNRVLRAALRVDRTNPRNYAALALNGLPRALAGLTAPRGETPA